MNSLKKLYRGLKVADRFEGVLPPSYFEVQIEKYPKAPKHVLFIAFSIELASGIVCFGLLLSYFLR